MSDTPRTDAEDIYSGELKGYVHSSFARELERELTAARAAQPRSVNVAADERLRVAMLEVERLRAALKRARQTIDEYASQWEDEHV